MLCTKYAQRDGWTHKDVLRLCHAKPTSKALEAVFRYVAKGELSEMTGTDRKRALSS
jgi:60 kDa SS-A/Ro ribonucleoprotein